MNLTWHIIRKDLHHLRWALAVWLGSLAYLFFLQKQVDPATGSTLRDYLQVVALLLLGLMSLGLLASLIQQDHPTDSRSFWRTRPISGARLVSAKLLTIGAFFVALPLALVALRDLSAERHTFGSPGDYALAGMVLSSLVLSLAAAASCTRSATASVALWIALILVTTLLGSLVLDRLAPTLKPRVAMMMNNTRVLAMLVFSAAASVAVILNQYLRRRLATSLVLLATGSVGTALIGSLWGYFYFYHA